MESMLTVCKDVVFGEVSHDVTCDDVLLDVATEAGQGNGSVVSSIGLVTFLILPLTHLPQ